MKIIQEQRCVHQIRYLHFYLTCVRCLISRYWKLVLCGRSVLFSMYAYVAGEWCHPNMFYVAGAFPCISCYIQHPKYFFYWIQMPIATINTSEDFTQIITQ